MRAYEQWRASRDAAYKHVGIDEFEQEKQLHYGALQPILDCIVALQAHTIEGMKGKGPTDILLLRGARWNG